MTLAELKSEAIKELRRCEYAVSYHNDQSSEFKARAAEYGSPLMKTAMTDLHVKHSDSARLYKVKLMQIQQLLGKLTDDADVAQMQQEWEQIK